MNRILVFAGDTWHPASVIRRGLAPLASDSFRFEFADNSTTFSASSLQAFRTIVLARANISPAGGQEPWMSPELAHGLAGFVQQGGGLLVIHAGTARYEKLPVISQLVGGAFEFHPEPCMVTMESSVENQLTHNVQSFTVEDEHYFVELDFDRTNTFLHSRSQYGVQPAGWTRREGNGRVCVLTPGHSADVWLHPGFQKLLSNALSWTTDDV